MFSREQFALSVDKVTQCTHYEHEFKNINADSLAAKCTGNEYHANIVRAKNVACVCVCVRVCVCMIILFMSY